MANDFVVDNSIVMAWFFDDEATTFTDSVQDLLVYNTAFVPSIWSLEVVNVLIVAERKKRISTADSTHFLALVSQLPIKVEQTEPAIAFHNILFLARKYQISSYDASYIELAIRKGLPVASLDKAIVGAAKDLNIMLEI